MNAFYTSGLTAAKSLPRTFLFLASLGVATCVRGQSPTPNQSIKDFGKYATMLEEKAAQNIEPETEVPRATPFPAHSYPWKINIGTEVFWVGQPGSAASAWDPEWKHHYGGTDDPGKSTRHNYIPIGFTPRENPFYCELPYNDVEDGGATKPEAPIVIPWFKSAYTKYGQSVCQNRWVEIQNRAGKTCYAQWSDCGPGRTDDWQYVFGTDKPATGAGNRAGLGVSPAVRDYLGLSNADVASWRFVDYPAVSSGPWSLYGDNNDFLKARELFGRRMGN
jgi:hypothetical protein